MASLIVFGVIIILMETNAISGTCTEQFIDDGMHNVLLEYTFGWGTRETKHVVCSHDPNTIGECYDAFGFKCFIELTSIGVYTMSTNADLTYVIVTILTVNSTMLGNYSCSKGNGSTNITKCAKYSVSTTPSTKTAFRGWYRYCVFIIILRNLV
ncbi:uncharacterized protein LOC127836618 [Dreissena polymorpha]|uniref:uncharacterized protein LOC127836618 n=1 Tax=Dreissena polymorpha TaxID=45954 RepID=UPI002264A999|nr:uncharacterized protein LOC127836618 [Dreissena polymorpha]